MILATIALAALPYAAAVLTHTQPAWVTHAISRIGDHLLTIIFATLSIISAIATFRLI